MQIPSGITSRADRILFFSVVFLLLLIGFLLYKTFKKDNELDVYKARMEGRQEALKELKTTEAEYRIKLDQIDTLLRQVSQDRNDAVDILSKTRAHPIIIKQYNDKINDIKHFNSSELKRYFTDL